MFVHSFGKPLESAKTLLIALIIMIQTPYMDPPGSSGRDLLIIVTTNGLLEDVKELVCNGDRVEALIQGSVDPHHYTLSPEDVVKIKNSDIIITTGHMGFEIRIREMVLRKELNVELVDPLLIEGILIKNTPGSGHPNLHGITYDPHNYKLLVNETYNRLTRINPGKSSCYYEKYSRVIREIEKIQSFTNLYRFKAVADTPNVQYAVEWLGIEILDIVVKEHDLPPDPGTLLNIEKLMRNRNVDLVITMFPSSNEASDWLHNLASKYDIPVLRVYDPNTGENTLIKLTHIIDSLENDSLSLPTSSKVVENTVSRNRFWSLVFALLVGIALPFIIIRIMKRWVRVG